MDYPTKLSETTFNYPDVFEKDKKIANKWNINKSKSEIPFCLEALGLPRVYYAARRNQYFKDMEFKKPYEDKELQEFDLPIPIEIETTRRKLQDKVLKEGLDLTTEDILRETSPSVLKPPKSVRDRLASEDKLSRDINRLNRATTGKR